MQSFVTYVHYALWPLECTQYRGFTGSIQGYKYIGTGKVIINWKYYKTKENRIYIRVEFNRKKCKMAILLYCFHTAGVLHIFSLYNLLGTGTSFSIKYKINIKRKTNYELGWFHNWPMIISHRFYAFQFTNDDFPL